jgi:hypothetical protein
MHRADEFVAMAALIDAGEAIEAVATRFGVSEKHVKQRLRLGKLAPELLDEFRAGEIDLEVVTAFTLGVDHAAQIAVWRQVKDNSYIQPYTVKRLLTESAIALDDDLAMFVGAAAYEAAGGTITRDPFSGDEDGFMDTPRSCAGLRSRSSKPRPPSSARNGPGPKPCWIPNTVSWGTMRAWAHSWHSLPRKLPQKSSGSSSASANSMT